MLFDTKQLVGIDRQNPDLVPMSTFGHRNTCPEIATKRRETFVDTDLRISDDRNEGRRRRSSTYGVDNVARGALHRSRTNGALPHCFSNTRRIIDRRSMNMT